MRGLLLVFLLAPFITPVSGQITITSADMPVQGDTLRYSVASGLGFNIDLNDTGANKTWNFDTLTPIRQRVDTYKTALNVSPLYFLISSSAVGYKVADTLTPGGGLPISVTEAYTFFDINGSAPANRYSAVGFGARISGTPIPAKYDNEDEIYFFPLAYGNNDTSDYYFDVTIPSIGRMVQEGERITTVDAWGTITTPFFTTAQSCIRVRSEVNGVDSVQLGSFPAVGIPRQTVDYKWLVQGEAYPALWVTTQMVGSTETVTAVRYRDTYRPLSIERSEHTNNMISVKVYPNPSHDILTVNMPVEKSTIEVFNMQGRNVMNVNNANSLNISGLAAGSYILRATTEKGTGYSSFVKE